MVGNGVSMFGSYLAKRAITYLAVFLLVVNLMFFLPRLDPGTAADILSSGGHLGSSSEVQHLTQLFGLNQPLSVQYELYLKNIFLSWPPNFGYSYQFWPQPVTGLFFARLPATLFLIIVSLFLAFFLAYGIASVVSVRRKGVSEFVALYSALFAHSTPVFWSSILFIWVFGITLHWFPILGEASSTFGLSTGSFILSTLWHSVLPVLAMTLSTFGSVYLLIRASTQQVQKSDFVLAARTRGLKSGTLARRYVLRNSLLPVISLLTFSLSTLISIAVLVEYVFGYSGVGDLIVDATISRDYPVLEGALFYLTIIIIIGGLIGDILLTRLDPRLRR
jgi:peptide/nickel transport system permease protein